MKYTFNKMIFLVVNIILIAIIVSSCSSNKEKKVNILEDINKVEDIKQKIVFIQQYSNFAETPTNRGYFIDNKGNKVSFDLESEAKEYGDINKLFSYLEKMEYETPEPTISQNDLIKYYNLLYEIDLNYKVEEKSYGADQGSDKLYGVRYYDSNNSATMILINETGDWVRNNTDKNAVKINEGLSNYKNK